MTLLDFEVGYCNGDKKVHDHQRDLFATYGENIGTARSPIPLLPSLCARMPKLSFSVVGTQDRLRRGIHHCLKIGKMLVKLGSGEKSLA